LHFIFLYVYNKACKTRKGVILHLTKVLKLLRCYLTLYGLTVIKIPKGVNMKKYALQIKDRGYFNGLMVDGEFIGCVKDIKDALTYDYDKAVSWAYFFNYECGEKTVDFAVMVEVK
jgi:hypothetical protein